MKLKEILDEIKVSYKLSLDRLKTLLKDYFKEYEGYAELLDEFDDMNELVDWLFEEEGMMIDGFLKIVLEGYTGGDD